MADRDESDWRALAETWEVEEDDVIGVKVGGRTLAVFNIGGAYYVTDDCCTHQQASLSEGYVQDDTIECPRHQGVFHVPTGKPMSPPLTTPLRVYRARVEDGRVWARVSE
ncbi:non-heme iron oxygenase ferredoxin subunit [Streptomyces albidus (ex Kaewkla and Franco 2022)]|uniref:non-heme iron oxygenase ferredoxin subunit n=1 Tax=Streptomyces albidus (ex Kaewkla and Franco 2022) TaxID=722709 RepID=UPI0015EEFD72|nr:non-heme iron oxygenase ferredoxin subunit [Streptomyces albidus (ex Kaewkla and Franco 2022)]